MKNKELLKKGNEKVSAMVLLSYYNYLSFKKFLEPNSNAIEATLGFLDQRCADACIEELQQED